MSGLTVFKYRLNIEEECDGLYKNKVIYLRKEYIDKKEYNRVFLHERCHAACDILGVQLDHHVEEVLVNTMTYLAKDHF